MTLFPSQTTVAELAAVTTGKALNDNETVFDGIVQPTLFNLTE